MTTIVSLSHVSKLYNHGSGIMALKDISMTVAAGEVILVLGPSGSGKTTLLQLIAGLLEPTHGRVELFGRSPADLSAREQQELRAYHVGFVFQNFRLLNALTAAENVAIASEFAGTARRAARERSLHLLRELGLSGLSARWPDSMSQGEQQRVAIARALVNDAQLILADEPTASLESSQGLAVIELLHACARRRNVGVVVASHDTRLIACADRVLYVRDGTLYARARCTRSA